MSDIVICAEEIGKKYTIGHQAERGNYTALRDVLMEKGRSLLHKTYDLLQGKPVIFGDKYEEFWALQDVNFEIRQGEAVGIIGRNGAGKSTLLKILSRITEPSTGRLTIKGRVASLLEVGTGFHPELSGRENIFLNGAILGMTRQEIKRKFDEIVGFAEVDKYLDTPVKRYSSGMYVRLAFAVAAHLEPEILVVDEVLAVGDAAFQQKCLGKMEDVASEGRTVLFVSHSMGAIQALCAKALWLETGSVKNMGPSARIVSDYTNSTLLTSHSDKLSDKHRTGTREVSYTKVQVFNHEGIETTRLSMGKPVKFVCELTAKANLQLVRTSVVIKTVTDIPVLHLIDLDDKFEITNVYAGEVLHFEIALQELILYPGTYSLSVWAGDFAQRDYDYLHDSIVFEVYQAPVLGRSLIMNWERGLVYQPSRWTLIQDKAAT